MRLLSLSAAFVAVSVGFVATAAEKTAPADKSPSSSEMSKIKNDHGFSITYPKCWQAFGHSEYWLDKSTVQNSESIDFQPSSNCPKDMLDKTNMEIGIDSLGGVNVEEYVDHSDATFKNVFKEHRKEGRDDAILYSGITRETNKLIERKEQANRIWSLIVICKKEKVGLSYSDHLDKNEREKFRKHPVIPPVFQALMDGFRCEN